MNKQFNNFKIIDYGNEIYKLAEKLFPINRSLSGNGNRETLKIIKKIIPSLKIHEAKSGKKVFDWEIPYEWNISDAYIIDPRGKKIVDFKNNNLHVVGYSIPVNKKLNYKELVKKIHFKKDYPSAIPYVTNYYKKDWGFCMSYSQFKTLKKGTYKVVINSKITKGSMTYADLLIKGKSKKEILLTSYICHPSMANNELSGPCLLTFIAKSITQLKNRNYSYRIVFHPENIGAINYLFKNIKKLKKNVIGGFVISCVGDNKNYSYIPSKYGNSLSDTIAKFAFQDEDLTFKKYSFQDSGSDERRYCAPGIDLPIASILRTKYGSYKEYHTSKDNLNFISKKGFSGSMNIYLKIIKLFENNFKLKIKTICEPQLSKRNLYPKISSWPNDNEYNKIKPLMSLIDYADGKNTIIDICNISGNKFDYVLDAAIKLKNNNLISIINE